MFSFRGETCLPRRNLNRIPREPLHVRPSDLPTEPSDARHRGIVALTEMLTGLPLSIAEVKSRTTDGRLSRSPHAIAKRKMRRMASSNATDDMPRHRSRIDKRAAQKDPSRCPLCGTRISRNAKGTRRMRHCDHCGGTLNRDIVCPFCQTYRVWTGKLGAVCHGCGHRLHRKPAPTDTMSAPASVCGIRD